MEESILPILLLPKHVTPIPTHLPLLRAIQRILNESYSKTFCAHPELFGSSYVRLSDPAKLQDIIGETGFTVILVRVSNTGADGKIKVGEVVATGSVRDFGDGDIETYVQWNKKTVGGNQGGAKDKDFKDTIAKKEKKLVERYEVTAFAVSTHHQVKGLGARVLEEIEWLVSSDANGVRLRHALADGVPMIKDIQIADSESTCLLEGIDINTLKAQEKINDLSELKLGQESLKKPKLVLIGIRDLGIEPYYQRRGFKSIWSGKVPVGTWGCKQECTMVYLEKDI